MRSALQLLRPSEASSCQLLKLVYICSSCRQEIIPRVIQGVQFRRNASDKTSFTEQVRRKIWGTDNPPGLKDPYGGEGVIEKALRRRGQKEPEEEQTSDPEQAQLAPEEDPGGEIAPPAEYIPATTWDGLERIGHLGRWSDFPPMEADEYTGFMTKRKLSEKGHLYLAAHQTAVELCLMHELKKPLTSVCKVIKHEKSVFKLILKCKINPLSESGNLDARLVFPDKEARDTLFFVFEQVGSDSEPAAPQDTPEDTEPVELAEALAESDLRDFDDVLLNPPPFFGYRKTRDIGFLSISLCNPLTKFAFLKRLSQITGHHFPDPVINSIQTVKQATEQLENIANPQPKRLADRLAANKAIQGLANVQVFPTRRTRSHEDEALGRRKLIEAELRRRGLIN